MADIENQNSLIPLSQAVETIKTAILQGQYEAVKGVNRIQLVVYFSIGKYLSENTHHFAYGSAALKVISEQLRKELPGLRGYSETQLKEMRKFYDEWIFLDAKKSVATDKCATKKKSVVTDESQLTLNQSDIYHTMAIPDVTEFPIEDFFAVPFTHHTRIIALCKERDARFYYIHRTAEEHLSVEALKKLINQQAYEHREEIPNNFSKALVNSSVARKAVMMFKDSYALDFINVEEIGLRDKIDVDERVIEKEIVQNVKNFIMTFGHDFTFVGNQYHLEVYNHDFFPDLLFFNRELNALVVVELKAGEFNPSYLGQLTTYLQILDDKVRKPHENPSIGIVLCKSADKAFVEYVIKRYDSPMGVATYTTADDMPENVRRALPDVEELKRVLNKETDKEKIVRNNRAPVAKNIVR